jgi:60 kDa SS-A/Ro ribonucleoprotein
MANPQVFSSTKGRLVPRSDTTNEAGGRAYALTSEQALAQFACTGCFNDTFYVKAEDQLKEVQLHAEQCTPEFVAQVAVYAREKGFMKDMPAFLLAHLCTRGPVNKEGKPTTHPLVAQIFDRVVDNGRMLRNFVQILRSGVFGRKSLGTAPKRLITKWLNKRSDYQIFRDSVGDEPSLVDVINMVHPAPETPARAALYGYLRGRPAEGTVNEKTGAKHEGWNPENLPDIVKEYEAFKANPLGKVPNVPFQMLDSLGLGKEGWSQVAKNAKWQMTRMNLNTFQRHDVLEDEEMVNLLAKRLSDKDEVKGARVFPYQILTAYKAAEGVPHKLQEALQDAMEHAIENVPDFGDKTVVVCPDVSGSMGSPVTGYSARHSSATTCVDVAALVSAAILRRNRGGRVIPFAHTLYPSLRLNGRDTIMTIAKQIGGVFGGGTDCSLPLAELNRTGFKADLVIFVSDSESWLDTHAAWGYHRGEGTGIEAEWGKFKANNPQAKLMCIDITPHGSAQVKPRKDVLQVGGFSDQVFELMRLFVEADGDAHWVDVIKSIEI